MEEYTSWIPIIIGLLVAGYVIYLYLKDRNLDHWPKVDGKVLFSEVVEEVDWDDGKRTKMYSPYVKYEYIVDGVSYKAENIGLIESSCSIKYFTEDKIRKFRSGKTVPVYYNPNSVGESYLEKDVGVLTYLLFIIISIGCLVGGTLSLLNKQT